MGSGPATSRPALVLEVPYGSQTAVPAVSLTTEPTRCPRLEAQDSHLTITSRRTGSLSPEATRCSGLSLACQLTGTGSVAS